LWWALVCSERRDDGPSGLKESGKATNFLERRKAEVQLRRKPLLGNPPLRSATGGCLLLLRL
jgi:hypothetical protein